MFSDTGDHSLKVFSPVAREYTPYLANGKGTRDGKSAQFVQPAGLIAEGRTVFIVHCSTSCDVYDFDCQCVNQMKAFLGTTAQTQGP